MTVEEVLEKIKDKKIVVFDFDNTICDLVIDWHSWDLQMWDLFHSVDPNWPEELKGKRMMDYPNDFITKYGDDFKRKLFDEWNVFEKENAKGCNPLERIVSIITQIENAEIWIWSGNGQETIKKYLKELGIENRFSKFITHDNVEFIKPSDNGFQKYKDPQVQLSEYLMIGNSSNDREAAGKAEIEYIDVKEIEG